MICKFVEVLCMPLPFVKTCDLCNFDMSVRAISVDQRSQSDA
jgi:hypothetical protein